MFADDVVDLAIFLSKGNAEITLHQVAQINEVLSANWLVKAVLGFQICANSLANGAIV